MGVICVLVLAAGALVGGYFGGLPLRPKPHRSAVAEPSALASATAPVPSASSSTAPAVNPTALTAALASGLADPRLGADVLGQVVDARPGTVLFDRSSATTAAPASTAKLATAMAVLTVHAPTDRIQTTVVAGATPGVAVLVGAGDPTLVGRRGRPAPALQGRRADQ